ncbi:MAG: TRAP transporter small permease [bacterium]|nr:TRAP transporter small permease [bacterium]
MTILMRVRDGLMRGLEIGVIVVMAALVLDVLWGVVTRFVLGEQSRFTEEVATYLLIWVSLLGASVAFSTGSHLGVDYFVGRLHPDTKPLVTVLINVIVAFFAASVMVYGGYVLVARTLEAGQVSPAVGIQMGYVYLAVPISGFFILIFCAENVAEAAARRPEAG